jgi:hypothetical protein
MLMLRSCVFLVSFSLILLLPFFSRSLLFVCGGLKQLLPGKVPALWNLLRRPVEAVVERSALIFSTNALLEVLAGFVLIFNLLTPARNFMMLLGFWQYLRIRYMLSADSKRAFQIVRVKLDGWIANPMCPAIIRTAYAKILSMLEQYTDQEAMAAQAGQGGIMSKCTIM